MSEGVPVSIEDLKRGDRVRIDDGDESTEIVVAEVVDNKDGSWTVIPETTSEG